jgi:hypothetical protein
MLAISPGLAASMRSVQFGISYDGSSSAGPAVPGSPVSPSLVVASSSASTSQPSSPKSLTIDDAIHGSFTIIEPVLVDLLLSKPVERLRHVLQHGITGLLGMTPSPAITRHEHSVGAMLLVRRAGGSIEAQAAALLHDIAHTALSHVVDGVFGYVVHEDDKMEYL